jgi:hypothetical protein
MAAQQRAGESNLEPMKRSTSVRDFLTRATSPVIMEHQPIGKQVGSEQN